MLAPRGSSGQGRLSQLRHFSHWADPKLPKTGADSRQNGSGGAPGKTLFQMNRLMGRQSGCRLRVSRTGQELRPLKRRLSRHPWPPEGKEQWATFERLQEGQGPVW